MLSGSIIKFYLLFHFTLSKIFMCVVQKKDRLDIKLNTPRNKTGLPCQYFWRTKVRTVLIYLFFEVCSDFWFGKDCDKRCNCLDKREVCDKGSGECRRGECPPGFIGHDCYQGET